MNWLEKLTIRNRLISASAILGILFLVFGVFSLLGMERLGTLTSLLYQHPLQVSNAAQRANTGIIKMHRSMKDVTLARTHTEVMSAMQDLKEEEGVVLQNLGIVAQQILGKEGRQLEREARDLFLSWRPIREDVLHLVDEGKTAEAALITKGRGADHVAKLERKMLDLNAYARNKADGFMANAVDVRQTTRWATVAAIGVLFISAALVTLILANSILSALNRLRGTMADISATGKLRFADTEGRHEISDMAHHFNTLVKTLQSQLNHREGLNRLNREVTALEDRDNLADLALSIVARQIEGCAGALYLLNDEGDTCRLKAGYALVERKLFSTCYRLGEGLVGQVAKEGKPILLTKVSGEDALGASGTVSEKVAALYAVPLQHDNILMGVLEVASFHPLKEDTLAYLNDAADVVATLLSNHQKEARIRHLLAETQQANALLELRGREVENANSQLTGANKELTAQAQELATQSEELRAQKKELERQRSRIAETDRLKSEFLSNMSHELRTPLNSILALSQLMLSRGKGVESEKEVEYLGVIERNGRRLLALINDILDLSKIEAGRMELSLGHVQVNDLVQEMIQTVTPLAEEKGLVLQVDVAPDIELVTDGEKLRQILLNLLSNAVKFTDEGSVRCEVGNDGARVSFAVKDTGIGIPAAAIPHIFDHFHQVDGATTRRHDGTGLGLAICQKLTLLMEGEIQVFSQEGQGSTFTLNVPLRIDESRPAVRENRVSQRGNGALQRPLAPCLGAKVLIVDDEEEARGVLRQFLEGAGYQVFSAEDGRQALEMVHQIEPDCITLDILMPEMDGWEVLRRLKSEEKTANIPVVIVSLSDDQATGFALGASDYLLKPIDRNLLLKTLSQLAQRHRIQRLLVVDDDPVVREHLTVLLSELDYAVETVPGGKEALARLGTFDYDAVVLDLMMPEVDGFAVIEQMRKTPRTTDLPIVVLTAKDLSGSEQTLLKRDVHRVIGKGQMERQVLLEQLDQTLRSILPPGDRKGILVVEDNEVAQLQIQGALASAGFKVHLACDGEEALETMGSRLPDGMVVDLMMPGMDGFELISRVRQWEGGQRLPILVLTAKELTRDDRDRLERQNVTHLVQKGSVNRQQLLWSVQSLFDHRPTTSPAGSFGQRILIVEDNPDNRLTLEALLEEKSYSFLTLAEGKEVLSCAREYKPGIILMDMQLPDIDGLQLTAQLKAEDELNTIPVVALTAKAMQGDREMFLSQGCDDYLSKPLDPQMLYDTLERWLG